MSIDITAVLGTELLDSRGQPALEVTLCLADGTTWTAGVPSGASTGAGEAVELRDGDPDRYDGRGLLAALEHLAGPVTGLLTGRNWETQVELDDALKGLDGTADLHRLGANTVVGVSLAAARAFAAAAHQPLYRQLAATPGDPLRLPVPHFNVLNGGVHASNPLEFQEFMIAPVGAPTLPEAVRAGAEVYGALRRLLAHTGLDTAVGDEGGFAPQLADPAAACRLTVQAIENAGYRPGPGGVALALDPAANGFQDADGSYRVDGHRLSTGELIDYYEELVDRFPIWSLEDPLAEGDRAGWARLTSRLAGRVQVVGDDLFTTSAARIAAGFRDGLATAALVKPNQIGTVTDTLDALRACRDGGRAAMVSHRSGETLDAFVADLAVGAGCGQLKAGAPARDERTVKYNRLLAIAAVEPEAAYGPPTPWLASR